MSILIAKAARTKRSGIATLRELIGVVIAALRELIAVTIAVGLGFIGLLLEV